MNRRGRTIGIALAGAVALASGAYALGTQVGGGSATASDNNEPERGVSVVADGPGFGFGFGGLADELGVSEDKLELAMRELRDEGREDKADVERELASALGISTERVSNALESLRDKGPVGRLERLPDGDCGPGGAAERLFFFGPGSAEDLAKELGLDEQKVEDALEQTSERLREQAEKRHDEFVQKLADKLGISVEKVQDALPDRPPLPAHP